MTPAEIAQTRTGSLQSRMGDAENVPGTPGTALFTGFLRGVQLNGVDPVAYLADTLRAIVDGHPQNRIEDLMPWRFQTSSSLGRIGDRRSAYGASLAAHAGERRVRQHHRARRGREDPHALCRVIRLTLLAPEIVEMTVAHGPVRIRRSSIPALRSPFQGLAT